MTSLSETIARLRELLAKATPEPWSVPVDMDDPNRHEGIVWDHGRIAYYEDQCPTKPDADLIAAMRNALPELLDAAEASIERNGSSERGASEVQASAHTGEPREHGEPVHDAALIADLNDWKESGLSRGDVKALEQQIADLKALVGVLAGERDQFCKELSSCMKERNELKALAGTDSADLLTMLAERTDDVLNLRRDLEELRAAGARMVRLIHRDEEQAPSERDIWVWHRQRGAYVTQYDKGGYDAENGQDGYITHWAELQEPQGPERRVQVLTEIDHVNKTVTYEERVVPVVTLPEPCGTTGVGKVQARDEVIQALDKAGVRYE